MVYVSDFVALLLKQTGDRYDYGAVASPDDADPSVFDCAELVRWACKRLGVVPTMPDGSWIQARHCLRYGTLVGVGQAAGTQGALLFLFSGDPFHGDRPSTAHVAVSLGNGSTIEARGRKWGVGSWSVASRRWTHGGLVPGIRYAQPPAAPGVAPAGPTAAWPGRFFTQPPAIRGDDVRRWQARMAARGWPLRVDGVYGPESEAVCREFQQENGLQVDGVVGATTWNATWEAAVPAYPGQRG